MTDFDRRFQNLGTDVREAASAERAEMAAEAEQEREKAEQRATDYLNNVPRTVREAVRKGKNRAKLDLIEVPAGADWSGNRLNPEKSQQAQLRGWAELVWSVLNTNNLDPIVERESESTKPYITIAVPAT